MLSDVVRGYWAENTEETLGWGHAAANCPCRLVARVALVAAYAWQEGSRQPIRAGEEKKHG